MRSGILALTLLMVAIIGCADRRQSLVREQLETAVASQSGGALSLSGFTKTNGIDREYGGQKAYTIEWQARIAVNTDVWKGGNAFEGYWSNFAVMSSEPSGLDSLLVGGVPRKFVKGTTVELKGQSTLEATENGWRITSTAVTASRVLQPAT
jgi:hypothetical protein